MNRVNERRDGEHKPQKVRLSITVEEAIWRALRDAAEAERSEFGRASVNAVVNRFIADGLGRRRT